MLLLVLLLLVLTLEPRQPPRAPALFSSCSRHRAQGKKVVVIGGGDTGTDCSNIVNLELLTNPPSRGASAAAFVLAHGASPTPHSLMPHPSTEKNDGSSPGSPRRIQEFTQMPDLKGYCFVLDSVAADHATGSAELLSGTRAPDGGGACFRRRHGKDLPVLAVGSMKTPRFSLPDVLLVPGLGPGRILVSVRQLARRGLAVTFGSDSCRVKERSTGAVVGEGRLQEDDGFYHLNFLRIRQKAEAFAPATEDTSFTMAHKYYEHK